MRERSVFLGFKRGQWQGRNSEAGQKEELRPPIFPKTICFLGSDGVFFQKGQNPTEFQTAATKEVRQEPERFAAGQLWGRGRKGQEPNGFRHSPGIRFQGFCDKGREESDGEAATKEEARGAKEGGLPTAAPEKDTTIGVCFSDSFGKILFLQNIIKFFQLPDFIGHREIFGQGRFPGVKPADIQIGIDRPHHIAGKGVADDQNLSSV